MEQKKIRNYEQSVIDARENPNDLFVLKKFVDALLWLKKYDEAAAHAYIMIRKIDEGVCGTVTLTRRAAICNLYAEALIKTGDFVGARHWASESLRILKEQTRAHYFLAMINDHLKNYDDALMHLDAILLSQKNGHASVAEDDFTPAPQDLCYQRAVIYRSMKKPVEERRELAAALRFDPTMTAALYDLAALLAWEKNFAQALSLITKARETEPSSGKISHLRSLILQKMERYEDAMCDAALAFQYGEVADSLLRLWIQTAKETGRGADALPAYALLIERRPEEADVLLTYIQLLVQKKDVPTALRTIDASLPFVKDDALRQVLGTIHDKLTVAGRAL
jgi:tetratricopeptide (TPR) repeat protein